MPSLIGTEVTTNYNRVVGPTYTVSADTRVYTGPYSNFGTRLLKFYKVEVAHNAVVVDFTLGDLLGAGVYTDSNSVFQRAVQALQLNGEIFYIGMPGTAGFIVAFADDTANSADSGNAMPGGFGIAEAAVAASINGLDPLGVTTCTITEVVAAADGLSIA